MPQTFSMSTESSSTLYPCSNTYLWPTGFIKPTLLNLFLNALIRPKDMVVFPSFCLVAATNILFCTISSPKQMSLRANEMSKAISIDCFVVPRLRSGLLAMTELLKLLFFLPFQQLCHL